MTIKARLTVTPNTITSGKLSAGSSDTDDGGTECDEPVNGTYKTDLYDARAWNPQAPFSFTKVDQEAVECVEPCCS